VHSMSSGSFFGGLKGHRTVKRVAASPCESTAAASSVRLRHSVRLAALLSTMCHVVAVGAQRHQVGDRVDYVRFRDLGQRDQVMHVYQALAKRPEDLCEVE
jgi:hypothetical protein